MRGYSSRDMIRLIEADGWYYIRASGDHYQYKHPTKPGKVTIPHPNKDLPKKTIASILKQAGLK